MNQTMMMSTPNPMLELEISVLSCQGLNLTNNSSSSSSSCSSFFPLSSLLMPSSKPITRPFISLTKLPPSGSKHPNNVYRSRLDMGDGGAAEGGLFRVPLDPSFFSEAHSCLHLQLYTKRRFVGPSQLGWCLIPASDIALLPPASVRYLSYRLRATDGCRGPAIINLSVQFNLNPNPTSSGTTAPAIGVPVKPIPTMPRGLIDSRS